MRAFRKKTVIALSVLALLFPYSVSADEIADQSAHAQSVTVSAVSSGTEAGHYCVETRKTDERMDDANVVSRAYAERHLVPTKNMPEVENMDPSVLQ